MKTGAISCVTYNFAYILICRVKTVAAISFVAMENKDTTNSYE
jgi:hypothetical protein